MAGLTAILVNVGLTMTVTLLVTDRPPESVIVAVEGIRSGRPNVTVRLLAGVGAIRGLNDGGRCTVGRLRWRTTCRIRLASPPSSAPENRQRGRLTSYRTGVTLAAVSTVGARLNTVTIAVPWLVPPDRGNRLVAPAPAGSK